MFCWFVVLILMIVNDESLEILVCVVECVFYKVDVNDEVFEVLIVG